MNRIKNISLALVLALVAAPVLAQQPNVTVFANPDRQWGVHHDSHQMMLFSPDPASPGQALIHWDNSAEPNLLMEPFISPEPNLVLDITPSVLEDLGYTPGTMTINVVPIDPPGFGFNDPTPFEGAPGNDAATLGEARMNLFNWAIAAWANAIQSDVTVDVIAAWLPLPCAFGQRSFGQPAGLFVDASLPNPNVIYPAALAEAIIGADLTGPVRIEDGQLRGGDAVVLLNSVGDSGCFPGAVGYYYGLDENAPPDRMFLGGLIRRSLAQALGFWNFFDFDTGAFPAGLPTIYDSFLFDETVDKTWDQMTNAERFDSSRRFREVVFNGPATEAAAADFMWPGMNELDVNSPPEIAGRYEVGFAPFFGAMLDAEGITADLVCMKDFINPPAGDVSVLNGCTPATNPDEVAGKIALVDRGGCSFATKAMNAEAAGALSVIAISNVGTTALNMGGTTPGVGIPINSVGNDVGRILRQAACPRTAVSINGDRFQINAIWATADGAFGEGQVQKLTDDTVWFYFFDQDNVELVVKVLDGCGINDRFWVFAGGLTDVQVLLTVTDTATGEVQAYTNNLGTAFQPITDTDAFATCL